METTGNRTALGVSADVAQLVGHRLKRARENTGRSTAVLSSKIKVREHYIIAIEEGQWNELPPGLNGRGLIRIYARELSVSVPELDQAANQSVMPAEQDAQAPYQLGHKKDSAFERDSVTVRSSGDVQTHHQRSSGAIAGSAQPFAASAATSRSVRSNENPFGQGRQASPSASKRVMDLAPDEAPLDVVTPDVASILGITLEGFDDLKQSAAVPNAQRVDLVETRGLNPVSTAPSAATMQQQQPAIETPANHKPQSDMPPVSAGEPVALSRELKSSVITEKEEAPLVMAEGSVGDFTKKPDPVPTPEDVPQKSDETKPAMELKDVAVSEVQDSDSPVPESAGVSAAQEYLGLQTSTVDAKADSSEVVEKAKSPLRWALGLAAACVAALVLGQLLLRTPEPQTTATEGETSGEQNVAAQIEIPKDAPAAASSAASTAVAPDAPKAVEQVATVAATTAKASTSAANAEPAKQQTAPVKNAVMPPAAVATAAAAVPTPPAVSAAPVSPAASEAEAEEVEPQESRAAPAVSAATGARAAVLTLIDAIDVQVTADGKRIYSGKQNAGKLEIKFNKNAEIIVQDGSKVKLKYAGWDHGALGQSGRKRRIVLRADAFSSPAGEN
ncbi:MAG: hypothetical protein RIR26_1131 [Pseudomonadota bacterium]